MLISSSIQWPAVGVIKGETEKVLPAFWGLSGHLWGLMRFFIYRHFCYLYYIFCITNIHIAILRSLRQMDYVETFMLSAFYALRFAAVMGFYFTMLSISVSNVTASSLALWSLTAPSSANFVSLFASAMCVVICTCADLQKKRKWRRTKF